MTLPSRGSARAVGLAAGVLLDAWLADPRRGHPVAGFGRVAGGLERAVYRDARWVGALHEVSLLGATALLGTAAELVARRRPLGLAVLTAAATWSVLGGTSLRREAAAMTALLAADDLPAARRRLSHLCGRDATGLDHAGLARATVESIAENTSDAVVAPLLWGAALGVPGLVVYRAVNTLDAMVGHRSPRYARFGWAAARTDDAANLLPARVSAALAVLLAPLVDGSPARALATWRADGAAHPSPNAGRVEAAFAGALGRRLGGPLHYGGRAELRPTQGSGAPPDVADIARAARLSGAVSAAAASLAVRVALARRR